MGRFGPSSVDGAYLPSVVETHSSLVFFVADRVYKLKKAIDLGFVDFTDRRRRLEACRREVALNRRLAPDVYLGVADITDASGHVCDHLVVMRRMPADRRLSALVRANEPLEARLDSLVDLLVGFHRRAERSPAADEAAGVDALAGLWSDNSDALAGFDDLLDADAIEAVDVLAHRYLDGRRALFETRVSSGRACDGHGDLLADDIFFPDDSPTVLDCLEFDDALRLGDVLADIAFLAMDLERLGRRDLVGRLLATYRAVSGDDWPSSLAHHHVAYRAQVRAKVSAVRAAQGDGDAAVDARQLLDLARSHLDAGRVRLILVGGSPGTGKSTLAHEIGDATGALVIRSDVVRKELAGIPSHLSAAAPFGEGLYSARSREAVYTELLDRADRALGMGQVVVLDASWTEEPERIRARRVAEATSSDIIELRCVAPAELLEQRIRRRALAGGDASDADADVAAMMAARSDPWPDAVDIDTSYDVPTVLGDALTSIGPV